MKKTLRFTALAAVLALIFTACERQPTPGGNEGNNDPKERIIVYTVGQTENRQNLDTEGEWDALLDVLCTQAQNGQTVTFYNMNQVTYHQNKEAGGTKAAKTFTTSNRDEMKAWMKEREKEGLTVVVTYNNGTWQGMAYASAPPASTSVDIIGTWHFICSVVNHIDQNGSFTGSDLFVPEDGGGSMHYTFYNDGTLTLTFTGMDGTTATDNSTWTLDNEGELCCELLPSGGCWNVNWITDNTMIISRAELGTEEGDLLYQLQFDRE
ncbi:MAG: hypothetical protein IKZ54_11100 [Bacteroidales bacterium]|nr:hypothetical protein [Bacteroidales bacterium]